MGGFGSGGRNATGAATCESYHSIDLAWLRRQGMLTPGRFSTVTWSRGGEETGSIGLVAQQDGVRLKYQTKDRDWLAGERRRARRVRLHANQVRRPPAVAAVPQMRQGLPEDLWRALFPVPAVLPPALRLAERADEISARWTGPTRSPSACTTSGAGSPRRSTSSRPSRPACAGRRTTASRSSTTICRTGGPSESWLGSGFRDMWTAHTLP